MFVRLIQSMLRHRRLALSLLALLSIPCAIATATLRLNPQWTNALPRNEPLINEYLEITRDPLRGSVVYVLLEGPEAEEAATRFSSAWESLPEVLYVQGAGRDVHPWELVLLSRAELQGLEDLARNLSIDEFLGFLFRKAVVEDELPAEEDAGAFYAYALEFSGQLSRALEAGSHDKPSRTVESLFNSLQALRAHDGDALLVRLGTSISEGSVEELNSFAEALGRVQSELVEHYPNLRVQATGYPVTASDEMRRFRDSGRQLTLWALLLIVVAMTLFMGDLREVITSMSVLLITLLWVMGLLRVLFGELNTVTMIMGLVLLGLGIDFCIHWLNYFRHGQQDGLLGAPLVLYVSESVQRPIAAGAMTSAGAFLCILFLQVPSLQEFAWMSAAGILIAALMVMFVMPLLVRPERPRRAAGEWVGRGLAAFTASILRKSRWVQAGFVAMLVLAASSVGGIRYEYNYAKLQIGGLPSYELKQEIVDRFGLSSDVLVLRVEGVEEARELKERLLEQSEIARVESISDYLPSPAEQELRARIISRIRTSLDQRAVRALDHSDLDDMRDLLGILVSVLPARAPDDQTRREIESLARSLARLADALGPDALSELNRFNQEWIEACQESLRMRSGQSVVSMEDLPQTAKSAFVTSERNVYLLHIFPAENVWNKDAAGAIEEALAGTAPMATGLSRISFRLTDVLLSEAVRMSLMVLLVILMTLRVSLGSWGASYLASMPLICGGLLTAGTLAWLDIPLNFYNLAGLPIILGIGVDDGVHLVHAFRSGGRRDPVESVRLTGGAILLTSMTSMIGFGCLSFYEHPGMSTLGIVLFTGVAWCLVSTLILIPVLLQRLSGPRNLI